MQSQPIRYSILKQINVVKLDTFQSQGQTLDEVIIDFSGKKAQIKNGSFYTALTRVKKGCHFHLTDFKPEYIQANKEVEKGEVNDDVFPSPI